jgi:RNA polymerase sigma-70 factor (ECF subfamily)
MGYGRSLAASLVAIDLAREARPEPPSTLVDACRGGDGEAIAALFESCRDRVYTLALHLTADPAEAGDITQDVFLRLLRRLDQFRGDALFSTWLYRVVMNVFLDRRKSRRRWAALDEAALAGRASGEPSPEATLIRSEVQARVARAVAALPVKLRLPVVLRYGAGLSYGEIAETLGVRQGTVASRLSRGVKRLAHDLEDVLE